MKAERVFFTLFFLFVFLLPVFSKNYRVLHDNFERRGKSILVPTCDVDLDENNQTLTVIFNETVGNVSISFFNESNSEILYEGRLNAKIGDVLVFSFDQKMNDQEAYRIIVTNGINFFIGAFE